MTLEPGIVIAIASITFSAGTFIGMYSSRFMSKKECQERNATMWAQVDAIRNCMTGGKIKFELRMIQGGDDS